jgi:hypothetical protein
VNTNEPVHGVNTVTYKDEHFVYRECVRLALQQKAVEETVWALVFETELARDNVFEWICFRMDRWEAWSEIAGSHGPRNSPTSCCR